VVSSVVQLARGEKPGTQLINHSLSHSPSLFDTPGTEAFTLKQKLIHMNRHASWYN